MQCGTFEAQKLGSLKLSKETHKEMTIKNVVAAILLLSAPMFAQNASPPASGAMRGMPVRSAATRRAALPSADAMVLQQIQELEATVSKMQALLKEMRSKAASSKSTVTQDNLRMWELLVGHLNDTLTLSRVQAAQRAGLMSRRNAMYRHEVNSDAAAARAANESTGTGLEPGAQTALAVEPAADQGSAPKQ
jgi:hypothetical protein